MYSLYFIRNLIQFFYKLLCTCFLASTCRLQVQLELLALKCGGCSATSVLNGVVLYSTVQHRTTCTVLNGIVRHLYGLKRHRNDVERHRTVLNGAVTVLYGACTVLNGAVRCCRPFTGVNGNLYGLVVRFCTVEVRWTVNGPFFWCRTVTVG